MILRSEFKRKKQQLTTPEKAAEILKASHQLHLCFIIHIIPSTSIGILLEVRIIRMRDTGSGGKAVVLGRALARPLPFSPPVGRHFSGSYSEEFLYLPDNKKRDPISSQRSKIFRNMDMRPKRIQKETDQRGAISEERSANNHAFREDRY